MATWRVPAFDRAESVANLREGDFDVVVVGAGATGAGCALDAAQRGLTVALIDKGDFASGTSSKSSKMIHGGLRYLSQRELGLVRENLRERQRLMANAPHLVSPLPFLIPLFGKDGVVSKSVAKGYGTALRLYDLAGGSKIGERHRRIPKEEALRALPSLNVDTLVAGFLYFDARADDARLTLLIAKSAADEFDATVANYVEAIGFDHDDEGEIAGVRCKDVTTGEAFTIATHGIINATGVWADELARLDEYAGSHRITPAKGVHVSVARQRLPAEVATVLTVPGDHRSVFVVPFDDGPFTYIGTTDTAYTGSLDTPQCTAADVQYLLHAVNEWTTAQLTPADVTGVWAGLRPLLSPDNGQQLSERTADLSRRHEVRLSDDGVIHVIGGKLTTYRQMAEDGVDELCRELNYRAPCSTASLTLWGDPSNDPWRPTTEAEWHLFRRYGIHSELIHALTDGDPSLGNPAVEGLPYLRAEMVFAAREEMAVTLVDLLCRRTRAHLMDMRATRRAAPDVAALVAPILGWDDQRRTDEVTAYQALCDAEWAAAGLRPDDLL